MISFASRCWLLAIGLSAAFGGQAAFCESRETPPNFLVILADDLGFSDLGCYGGEIQTPNIDRLAVGGLRFSQFYNTGRCWPTRAALLTGYYAQQVNRDKLPNTRGRGVGKRPDWGVLLSQRLAELGYRSYHSGKWHVDGQPLQNGFARSYRIDTCERYFNPANNYMDDKSLPQGSPDDGYYATTAIADHAIDCIGQHCQDQAGTPFFAYVAFTAPHFPLHALPEDIAKYADRYAEGWDVVRRERWRRISDLGFLRGSLSPLEPEVGPPYYFEDAYRILGPGEVDKECDWESLTAEQKAFQAAKMSIHAAMVDRIDQEVGRILQELEHRSQLDNTVIFFLSDNGATAEIMVRGDGHDPEAAPGSAPSYLCLGPSWSRAANTPMRRHKTWTHEGGIATPFIVHWPKGINAPGGWRDAVGHVIDFAPTLLQLAGGSGPLAKPNAPPAPGVSFAGSLTSSEATSRPPLWWLHEGNRAIRSGDWKLVAARGEPWELYDLSSDRTETRNLAQDMPQEAGRLAEEWESLARSFEDFAKK